MARKVLHQARTLFEKKLYAALPHFVSDSGRYACRVDGVLLAVTFQGSSKKPEFTVEVAASVHDRWPSVDGPDEFRTRLGRLFPPHKDYWWKLTPDTPATAEEAEAMLATLPRDLRLPIELATGIASGEVGSQLEQVPSERKAQLSGILEKSLLKTRLDYLQRLRLDDEPEADTQRRIEERTAHAVDAVVRYGVLRWRAFLESQGRSWPR